MKIAIINRHPKDVIGGSEIQCDGIAARLSNRSHQVYYIAPSHGTTKDFETNYEVVQVRSNAHAIAEAVLKIQPDIVYWRLNKYHFYRAAKKIAKANIPIVFAVSHISDTQPWSCRENMLSGIKQFLRGFKQGIKNVYNHQGFRHIKGVTVINPEHLYQIPIKDQCFVPNTISDYSIPFSWPRPFIVWVSNIKPAKQPELFIKLAKEFKDQNIDFLMVGSIQYTEYNWIENENNNTPNFHYLGSKSLKEVNGVIEQSQFLIHTCKPEGFGSVFLQAWLKRKPTISLGFDPGSYIRLNDLGGYVDNNWDKFVERTQTLVNDANERKEIGTRAYEFATETFSAENSTMVLESFLSKIYTQNQKSILR